MGTSHVLIHFGYISPQIPVIWEKGFVQLHIWKKEQNISLHCYMNVTYFWVTLKKWQAAYLKVTLGVRGVLPYWVSIKAFCNVIVFFAIWTCQRPVSTILSSSKTVKNRKALDKTEWPKNMTLDGCYQQHVVTRTGWRGALSRLTMRGQFVTLVSICKSNCINSVSVTRQQLNQNMRNKMLLLFSTATVTQQW